MPLTKDSIINFLQTWKDKEKKFVRHPIIDVIPLWMFISFFVVFVFVLFLVILLGSIKGVMPSVYERQVSGDYNEKYGNESIINFYYGKQFFDHQASDLSGLNQELNIYFQFYKVNGTMFGFSKNDLSFLIDFYGKRNTQDEWIRLDKEHKKVNKTLFCPQSVIKCVPTYIEWLPHIQYRYYRIDFTLLNGGLFVDDGLLMTDKFDAVYEYTSKGYTSMELILRYVLFIIGALFFIFFVSYTFFFQLFKTWLLEQKIVGLLLFVLMLYNNPLFVFDIIFEGFLFPLLNLVFMGTFICFLMYAVLIVIHASIKKPKQRTFFSFHFPKLVIVFGIWLVLIILLIIIRFKKSVDPSSNDANWPYNYEGYYGREFTVEVALGIALFISIFVYICTLLFVTVRACGFWCKGKLPKHYSNRVKIFFCFTFVIVIGSLLNMILISFYHFESPGQMFVFFIGYNLYVYILTILYLPSSRIRSLKEYENEENGFDMEDDLPQYQTLEEDDDDDDDEVFEQTNEIELKNKKKHHKKVIIEEIDVEEDL